MVRVRHRRQPVDLGRARLQQAHAVVRLGPAAVQAHQFVMALRAHGLYRLAVMSHRVLVVRPQRVEHVAGYVARAVHVVELAALLALADEEYLRDVHGVLQGVARQVRAVPRWLPRQAAATSCSDRRAVRRFRL